MGRRSFIGVFILIIAIFFYWRFNAGPVSGNPECQAKKTFKSYEFEAEVVNKYEGSDTRAVTLVTFDQQPATIDLTLEKNGLYDQLVIGDTLKKKFGRLYVRIHNFEKDEKFDLKFDCK